LRCGIDILTYHAILVFQ